MDHKYPQNKSNDVEDQGFCNISLPNVSQQSLVKSYLLCVFIGLLSALITSGNLLVIISIFYFKQLHTPTNYLILSLAVADLLVGVIVLPFSAILSVNSCWYLSFLLCKIRGLCDMSLCTSSILSLSFISVDRYYVVCQPLTYRTKMTVHVIAIMILFSWAFPALSSIGLTMSGLNQSSYNKKCNMFQNTKSVIMGAILTSYIPAIVIFSIYLKILAVAHRQARSIQNSTKAGDVVSKMEKKATTTLAVVVGIYLLSWSPFFFCLALYLVSSNSKIIPVIDLFKWFGWSNSMLNPFIYAFFYTWFRSAFKLIISGKIFQQDLSNSKLS